MSKYSGFFAAYNASVKQGNTSSKEETILEFTNDRTSSLKELSETELAELTKRLQMLTGKHFVSAEVELNPKGDKMRKSIIAIFKKMHRSTQEAKDWAEKQGVKGVKRSFNEYSNGELYILIRIAEKVLSDWQIAIRKKILPAK